MKATFPVNGDWIENWLQPPRNRPALWLLIVSAFSLLQLPVHDHIPERLLLQRVRNAVFYRSVTCSIAAIAW